MSKARYTSDDVSDEALVKISDPNVELASARRTANLGKRNNSMGLNYYECANEKLYEAYAELHLLAQGTLWRFGLQQQLRVNNSKSMVEPAV